MDWVVMEILRSLTLDWLVVHDLVIRNLLLSTLVRNLLAETMRETLPSDLDEIEIISWYKLLPEIARG